MGVTNSSFDTNQSISGIRYEINGKENIILGYYVSSQFKAHSDYQFKKIMDGSKLKHKIFDIKFDSGYYLQNIVHEENDGHLSITFQTVNYLGLSKPIALDHPYYNDKTCRVQKREYNCGNSQYISSIKIKDDDVDISCHKSLNASRVKGIDNMYVYMILIIIVAVLYYHNVPLDETHTQQTQTTDI